MNGKTMDLSIIVPVYNKEKSIRTCMDSLLAELPPLTEILLIDDGSTDKSPLICDSYGRYPCVRVFHQPNAGLASVRNTGIIHARGRYIGFCDSDDYVHPQMFRKLLYSVKKHDADIIICGYVRTSDRSRVLPGPEGYRIRSMKGDDAFRLLVAGKEPVKSYAWNKLIRAELFDGIRYPDGRLYEDQFTTWRLIDRAQDVLVTDWPAYGYVDDAQSITNAPWKPSHMDYIDAWSEIVSCCRDRHRDCLQTARDQLVSACVYSLGRLVRSGSRDAVSARRLLREIRLHGSGYKYSRIAPATGKRKLLVAAVLRGEHLRDLIFLREDSIPSEGIYVEMSGRLGNQMFRYAFARWLMEQQKRQEPLFLDFSNIDRERKKNEMPGWEDSLRHFQVLPYERYRGAEKPSTALVTARERMILSSIRAAEYPLKKAGTNARLACHKKALPWLNRHGLYLLFVGYDYPFTAAPGMRKIVSGPFECARYPEEIRDILLREFVPKYPLQEESREMMDLITTTNSVCITVRRGNYLQYAALDVCSPSYFERAARRMAQMVDHPVFFVFSDDVEWCRSLDLPGEVYYESGNDPVWEKLRLMSACRHFIISNSTFSWWAQFLGRAQDKKVIAPGRWFNGEYQPPLREHGWYLMDP